MAACTAVSYSPSPDGFWPPRSPPARASRCWACSDGRRAARRSGRWPPRRSAWRSPGPRLTRTRPAPRPPATARPAPPSATPRTDPRPTPRAGRARRPRRRPRRRPVRRGPPAPARRTPVHPRPVRAAWSRRRHAS
ncbi:hypothetical protein F5972_18155 [Microbispora cellulosiformans]|uniref:Uncharacterized protein n=1 Tax=Microbispora cellulosiformans TaxID=2614688 RepID=A0A5J5K0P6_9ACTN|nr:hypothetical protein F5972_18155 [Microbispora cellulosiformans]